MRFRFIWDLSGFFPKKYYNFKNSLPCQVLVSHGYPKFKLLVQWLCRLQRCWYQSLRAFCSNEESEAYCQLIRTLTGSVPNSVIVDVSSVLG